MQSIIDLSVTRTWKQAILFYIINLALVLVVGAFFVAFGIYITETSADKIGLIGLKFGSAFEIIYVSIMSLSILKAKGMFNNIGYIFFVLLSSMITFFTGSIIGLIAVAFLTTRNRNIKIDLNLKKTPDQKY